MKDSADPTKIIYGVSRRGREMLQGAGINTLGDVFPRFGPHGLMVQFPYFSRNDLFGLAAALRDNFGNKEIRRREWTKGAMRRALGSPSYSGEFPQGTDQGVINRFIHSATTGKHYKKPRWRRTL